MVELTFEDAVQFFKKKLYNKLSSILVRSLKIDRLFDKTITSKLLRFRTDFDLIIERHKKKNLPEH